MPTVLSAVQTWERWWFPWWTTCASTVPARTSRRSPVTPNSIRRSAWGSGSRSRSQRSASQRVRSTRSSSVENWGGASCDPLPSMAAASTSSQPTTCASVSLTGPYVPTALVSSSAGSRSRQNSTRRMVAHELWRNGSIIFLLALDLDSVWYLISP